MQELLSRLDFGAYAGYIWAVYALAVVMLGAVIIASYRHHTHICRMIIMKQRREQRIRAAQDASKEPLL